MMRARALFVFVAAMLFVAAAQGALFVSASADLGAEARRARAEGKGLAVMVELPDCAVCLEMKRTVFTDARAAAFGKRFRTVRLDVEQNRPLVDPSGTSSSTRELARRCGVRGTPTFLFFDNEGRLAYRHVGGFSLPSDLVLLGEFVRGARYDQEPFAEYLQRARPEVPFAPVVTHRADHGFALSDPTGRVRTLGDYRGKVVVMFFGYTHCPDVCPTTLGEMREVMRRLGRASANVQVLFVTLDPERDTRDVLAQYAPAFDRRFVGLAGSREQTDDVVRRFQLVAERHVSASGHYSIDHTASLFVFDRAGRLRLQVPYGQPAEHVVHDLRALLRERPTRVGAH